MGMPRGLLFVAITFVLALPASAAERMPAVAVVDVRAVDPMDAAFGRAARESLASALASYRVRVVTGGAAMRAQQDPAVSGATIAKARALADEGRAHFERQEPADAEARFRAAADLLEEDPCALESPDDLVEDYLFLARIFFATDRAALVREVVRRIVQLSPDLVLAPSRYSPQLIRAFDAVRAEILVGALGTLHVDVSPNPAQVVLDGRPRGASPLDVVNLPPGIHRLCVKRDGFLASYRPVDVTGFRVEQVHAELTTSRLERFVPAFDPIVGADIAEWFDRVASEDGADLLVFGRVEKDGLDVRAYSRAQHGFGAVLRLPRSSSGDACVAAIFADAVARGWILPVAARKNIAAGGGALDETAPRGFRVSLGAGGDLLPDRVNFPRGPEAGVRIALDHRVSSRWVASIESGLEVRSEGGIVLVDSTGTRVSPGERGVVAIDVAAPLDLSLRWYAGLSTWAPFVAGGAGLRADWLSWEDTMPQSSIARSTGLGGEAWVGGGLERAIGPRSAFSIEARAGLARSSNRSILLRNTNAASRRVPVETGLERDSRISIGWRRTF